MTLETKRTEEDLVAGLLPRLYHTAYYLARDPQGAEDAVQTTLLKFLQAHRQGPGRIRTPLAWCLKVLARDCWKGDTMGASQPLDEGIASEGGSPEDLALARERRALVRQAMEALPQDEKEALSLHVFGDLSMRELASTLELPTMTAYERVQRGLVKLRKCLESTALPVVVPVGLAGEGLTEWLRALPPAPVPKALGASVMHASPVVLKGGLIMSGTMSKPVLIGTCAVLALASVGVGVADHRLREENETLRAQAASLHPAGPSASDNEALRKQQIDKDRQLKELQARCDALDARLKDRESVLSTIPVPPVMPAGDNFEAEMKKWFQEIAKTAKSAVPRSGDPPVRVTFQQFLAGGMNAQLDDAEVAYLKTVADQAGDPNLDIALVSFLKGADRIERLKAVLARNPDSVRGQLELARAALQDQGNPETFEAALRESKRLDAGNGFPFCLEMVRRVGEGKMDEAVGALSEAVRRGVCEDYQGIEYADKEELLRRGGYSVGPRRAIAFLNGLVAGPELKLDTLTIYRDTAQQLCAHGTVLEQAGQWEAARNLYRSVAKLGDLSRSEDMTSDLVNISIQKMGMNRLKDLYARQGQTDLARDVQASLDTLKQRSTMYKEATASLSTPETTGRIIGSEDAMAAYFESVMRNGESAAARAMAGK